MSITANALPSMEGAVRRLAYEIMGLEPEDVEVSEDGMTVVTRLDSGDGPEEVSSPLHDFLSDLAEMSKAALTE